MAATEPDFTAQLRGVGYPEIVAIMAGIKRRLPAVVGFSAGVPRVRFLTIPVSKRGNAHAIVGQKGQALTELTEIARVHYPDLWVVPSDHPVYVRDRERGID